MLDGMIKLMETIVAMEKLKSVDVNADNKIDLGEMFTSVEFNTDGSIAALGAFKQEWLDAKNDLLEFLDSEDGADVKAAMQNTKITFNGITQSMYDLFDISDEELNNMDTAAKERYHAIMSAFYNAAMSGDYSNESIMQSIKDVLISTGYEGDIDIGDLHITIH